jgi:hypothetical protein
VKRFFLVIISFIFLNFRTWANSNLNAHEHGHIKLSIAVEDKKLNIELDGPAESFIGFEYLPVTKTEKLKYQSAKNLWEKNLFQLIKLDQTLNCKIENATFLQVVDETETKEAQAKIKNPNQKLKAVHSDIEAKAQISCAKKIAGTKAIVQLKKSFKSIQKVELDLLSEKVEKLSITTLSAEVNL